MNGEYRVYDTEQKKYVTDERLWFIATDGTLYYLKTENAGFVKAHNCVVEWSLGVTDKNNKSVYERDILSHRSTSYPYVVGFGEGRFKIEDRWGNTVKTTQEAVSWFEMEVIGNVHDNPELLEAHNDDA